MQFSGSAPHARDVSVPFQDVLPKMRETNKCLVADRIVHLSPRSLGGDMLSFDCLVQLLSVIIRSVRAFKWTLCSRQHGQQWIEKQSGHNFNPHTYMYVRYLL